MNIAIIDIGSNTIRLNVYNYKDGKLNLLLGKKNMAGLVSYVDDKKLTDKGILKLCRVLKSHGNIVNSVKHDMFCAFATASLRNLKNTEEVLTYVKDMTDIDIEMIEQKDEARLGFDGILSSTDIDSAITVDIGGGSTEIIRFEDKKIVDMFNLSEGSLSLYNRCIKGVLPTKDEIKEMQKIVKNELKENCVEADSKTIVGIGGTIRAIGNVSQEMYTMKQNNHFSTDDMHNLYDALSNGDKKAIQTVLKVKPERIHTLIPGMTIFSQLCDSFGTKDIFVSATGLREGVIYEKLKLKGLL